MLHTTLVFILIHSMFYVKISSVPPGACFARFRWEDCGGPPRHVLYYWKPGSRCEVGIWRGCLPNENMFPDEYSCVATCIFASRAEPRDYHSFKDKEGEVGEQLEIYKEFNNTDTNTTIAGNENTTDTTTAPDTVTTDAVTTDVVTTGVGNETNTDVTDANTLDTNGTTSDTNATSSDNKVLEDANLPDGKETHDGNDAAEDKNPSEAINDTVPEM